MPKPTTRRDLVWGYVAQFLNVGTGILLLPIILHYFSPADVGLWIVFVTLGSLAQLLEFGFQPTIARNAAYIYGGARNLQKEGLDYSENHKYGIDLTLLGDLIAASRRIYRLISLIAALILLTVGTFYVATLITKEQNYYNALLGWCTFAAGYILSFYFGYINGLLQGRGDVTEANKVVVIQRAMFLVLGIVFTTCGAGLLGLGLASVTAALVGRILAVVYFNKNSVITLKTLPNHEDSAKIMAKTLWFNASRLGAVQLGAFLINRASILIASTALGVSQAASYSLTLTILLALASSCGVIAQINVPYMSSLQVQQDRATLTRIYRNIVLISSFTYVVGFTLLSTLSKPALAVIGSSVPLLPSTQILILGIIIFLEVHHSNAATVLTTTNKVPFMAAALWSGLAIVILSCCVVKPLGIVGMILSQGLIQILYNNWKWPSMILKILGTTARSIYLPIANAK